VVARLDAWQVCDAASEWLMSRRPYKTTTALTVEVKATIVVVVISFPLL
jgi:hypothetical protein